jgi:methylamine dehydrogenase heavy chain
MGDNRDSEPSKQGQMLSHSDADRVRHKTSWRACALAATYVITVIYPLTDHADVPTDTPGTVTLPPSNGHRLYVTDQSLKHLVDSKVHVIDGDTFRLLGTLNMGQFGFVRPSGDGQTIYHAGSFYSRGDHGSYSEVLEFYDPATLSPRSELIIPTKRASTMNYPEFLVESAQARYLYIQNATPASSVTVVDLAQQKVLTEIQTAGCFGIYPALGTAGRFSTLCGDGAVITISFDTAGQETSRKRSAKLFDPDHDALFIAGLPYNRHYLFISFLGNVHTLDVESEIATQQDTWNIVSGKSASEGWRPGGYQLIACNQKTGQLYVAMHPHGKEGSHKDVAAEIWRVDLTTRAVAARGPGSQASFMTVTDEERPLVYTLSPVTQSITKHDGTTLKVLGESPKDGLLEGGGPLFVH